MNVNCNSAEQPSHVYLVASMLAEIPGVLCTGDVLCTAGRGTAPCVRVALPRASLVPVVQRILCAHGLTCYPVHSFNSDVIVSAQWLHSR